LDLLFWECFFIYVFFKLERNFFGYSVVGIFGAAAALLWSMLFVPDIQYGLLSLSAGAVSSLIMARLALPVPDTG